MVQTLMKRNLLIPTVATTLAEIVENAWYDKEVLEENYDACDTTGKGYYARVGYMNTKWHDKDPNRRYIKRMLGSI